MSKISKSDLPKEFRAQIEAERDRLNDEARSAQAEMDRIAGRQAAIATLLSAYDTTPVVQTKVLLLAPPEKKKRAKSSKPRASKGDRPDRSNLEMMIEALRSTMVPMSGVELRTWVRENLWAECPAGFASAPFGYIEDGRLVKDGSKFKLPKALGESLPVKGKERAAMPPPKPPAPMPAAAPPKPAVVAAKPQVDSPMVRKSLVHNGNETLLTSKHWRLVDRLKSTMGKGYLPHKACVAAALGTDFHGNAEEWLRSERTLINDAIAPVGLTMVVEKAGVFLREAS